MKNCSIGCSVKAALRGIQFAFKNERNFRIEIYIAVFVISALIILKANLTQTAIVITMIFLVFMIELMNTAIERVVDILKPRKHPYAKVIKDVSAATVLVLSVGASIVGVIIFTPLILEIVK
ncbi:MAG: diacylglycerol kinase [Candidatus Moraniibacteriota bacterium]|jgi:diacylglycerol kinase